MTQDEAKTALAAAIESFPGYGITGQGMTPLGTLIGGALAETDMALVPRHLLTALTDAADDMVPWVEGPTFYSDHYDAARAAVVEAVGPTREDQR